MIKEDEESSKMKVVSRDLQAIQPLVIKLERLDMYIQPMTYTSEGQGGPNLEWLHGLLTIDAHPFAATFDWSIEPLELRNLAEELTRIYKDFSTDVVELKPIEGGLFLTFKLSATRGNIIGKFEIRPEMSEKKHLVGEFGCDQTYIPIITKAIYDFLQTILICT